MPPKYFFKADTRNKCQMLHLADHVIPDAVPLTIELFSELCKEYTMASNSLLPPPGLESSEEADTSPVPNALAAQARLLRSILDRITSSHSVSAQGASDSTGSGSSSTTDQLIWQSVDEWPASNRGQKDPHDLLPSMLSAPDDGIGILQDLGFEMINSRFEEAGLVLWDEDRIFIRSL